MSEKRIQYLPFASINNFMVDEFRLKVIRSVMTGFDQLAPERRSALAGLIKRMVNVPGFRNSSLAPLPLKVKGMASSFERSSDLAAQVMMAWSEQRPELMQQVYDLLTSRDWKLIPADADRTRLPGFLITWPKGESYDSLGKAFTEKYPDLVVDENDLRLMAVWIGGRLPYEDDDEEIEGEEEVEKS
jgi:hypothetical protein